MLIDNYYDDVRGNFYTRFACICKFYEVRDSEKVCRMTNHYKKYIGYIIASNNKKSKSGALIKMF